MRRRDLLWIPAVARAQQRDAAQNKLLLPSDVPDALGFRLMWYNPTPPIDVARWRLKVRGMVEKPAEFTVDDLRKLPQTEQSSRMKCVQCWSSRTTWGGFRFGEIIERVKPLSGAKAVRLDCADKWYEYMSLAEMAGARVLLAMSMAGKPLTPSHGAPLRLLDPSKYGYKSAKLITSITFVPEGKGSMACDIGPYYSPTGEILAGFDTPLDLHPEAARPGWKLSAASRRKIKGGEITEY